MIILRKWKEDDEEDDDNEEEDDDDEDEKEEEEEEEEERGEEEEEEEGEEEAEEEEEEEEGRELKKLAYWRRRALGANRASGWQKAREARERTNFRKGAQPFWKLWRERATRAVRFPGLFMSMRVPLRCFDFFVSAILLG